MYTDNKKVLRFIHMMAQVIRIPSIQDTFQSDHDLLSEFESLLSLFPLSTAIQNYGAKWVKAHQDRNSDVNALSVPAQLNISVDSLCTSHLRNCKTQRTSPISHLHLPNPNVSILLHGNILPSQVEQSIREEATTGSLIKYIKEKWNIQQATFDNIDWEAFHRAQDQLNLHSRISILKLIHSWQHTGSYHAKITRTNS